MKITEKINLNELIDKFPDVIPVLMKYGLHCVGCVFSSYDTLETGAKLHGIEGKELEMMLKDVNKVLEKSNGITYS